LCGGYTTTHGCFSACPYSSRQLLTSVLVRYNSYSVFKKLRKGSNFSTNMQIFGQKNSKYFLFHKRIARLSDFFCGFQLSAVSRLLMILGGFA
jgi:hypothetical protein